MASDHNTSEQAIQVLSPFDTFKDFQRSLGQTILLRPGVSESFNTPKPASAVLDWSTRLRKRNEDRNISMEECLSTLYNILKDEMGENTAEKILKKIRTPSVWRYWCTVAVVLAGFTSRFWPLKSNGLLSIQLKHGISTNNILESKSGVVLRMPYYADTPLRQIKFTDFIDFVIEFNPSRKGFGKSRPRSFWVFHAVVTLEYHFESLQDQIDVLDQANSSRADDYWKERLESQVSYNHPSNDDQRVGSATGHSAYLLPHCVHHRVGSIDFCTYTLFLPAFLAVNRLRLLSEDCARYAYKSVLADRVRRNLSSPEWRDRYLKTMDTAEAKNLWAAINLGRAFATGQGFGLSCVEPSIPTEFQVAIKGDFRVPLAQPAWHKDELPINSFMTIMLHINPQFGRQLTLKEIKVHWKYQDWEQYANEARETAEQDSLRETYDTLCQEKAGCETAQAATDRSLVVRQSRPNRRPTSRQASSTRSRAPSASARATPVSTIESQRQMLQFRETTSMIRRLRATIRDNGATGLDAAALKTCWDEMDFELTQARQALDASRSMGELEDYM